MPCMQGQMCSKSPIFGGASSPYGHGKRPGRPWTCTTDFQPEGSGAIVHLCAAGQGFSLICEAAPPWSGDHRSVVAFAPGGISTPWTNVS